MDRGVKHGDDAGEWVNMTGTRCKTSIVPPYVEQAINAPLLSANRATRALPFGSAMKSDNQAGKRSGTGMDVTAGCPRPRAQTHIPTILRSASNSTMRYTDCFERPELITVKVT
jgi:hypothetical protein